MKISLDDEIVSLIFAIVWTVIPLLMEIEVNVLIFMPVLFVLMIIGKLEVLIKNESIEVS